MNKIFKILPFFAPITPLFGAQKQTSRKKNQSVQEHLHKHILAVDLDFSKLPKIIEPSFFGYDEKKKEQRKLIPTAVNQIDIKFKYKFREIMKDYGLKKELFDRVEDKYYKDIIDRCFSKKNLRYGFHMLIDQGAYVEDIQRLMVDEFERIAKAQMAPFELFKKEMKRLDDERVEKYNNSWSATKGFWRMFGYNDTDQNVRGDFSDVLDEYRAVDNILQKDRNKFFMYYANAQRLSDGTIHFFKYNAKKIYNNLTIKDEKERNESNEIALNSKKNYVYDFSLKVADWSGTITATAIAVGAAWTFTSLPAIVSDVVKNPVSKTVKTAVSAAKKAITPILGLIPPAIMAGGAFYFAKKGFEEGGHPLPNCFFFAVLVSIFVFFTSDFAIESFIESFKIKRKNRDELLEKYNFDNKKTAFIYLTAIVVCLYYFFAPSFVYRNKYWRQISSAVNEELSSSFDLDFNE
jgi:hypothetical protein